MIAIIKKTGQTKLWFLALLMGGCSSPLMVFVAIFFNNSFQWWTISGSVEYVLIGIPCLLTATAIWKMTVFRKTSEYLQFE